MGSPTPAPTTGNFEFFSDYEKTVYQLQPDLYAEIKQISDAELRASAQQLGRPPKVLDVGSAGLIPYDAQLAESVTILDLFPQPSGLQLKPKVSWQVGDILKLEPGDESAHDVIVMSSLLHHLADKHNNATANVRRAFQNAAKRLRPGGKLLVFESVCPGSLALLQDLLYPVTSRILTGVLKFTYVRMLSRAELLGALASSGLRHEEVAFRQPPYIAQMRWRVPSKYYPLSVGCFRATRPAEARS